jgi:non-specific serine/threonine protein kinase
LRQLEVEHDNLRAALAWSTLERTVPAVDRRQLREPEVGLRLAGALFRFWEQHGDLREGERWLEAAIATSDCDATAARAWALIGIGYARWSQGDKARAWTLFEESLGLYRALGDGVGTAQALYYLGWTARTLENYTQAVDLYQESLALCREQQDAWTGARILTQMAELAGIQQDQLRAIGLLEESLLLARVARQPSQLARSLFLLGEMVLDHGDVERAAPLVEEGLTLARASGVKGTVCGALRASACLARARAKRGARDPRACHWQCLAS